MKFCQKFVFEQKLIRKTFFSGKTLSLGFKPDFPISFHFLTSRLQKKNSDCHFRILKKWQKFGRAKAKLLIRNNYTIKTF
jgi:hypothetical protein